MNLIWKRPDGYHGAMPTDFHVITLGEGGANLWVHKKDRDTFPFRVSGGWEEEQQTKKLNNLVSMIGSDKETWLDYLRQDFNNSMHDKSADYASEICTWLNGLNTVAKGDVWERDIVHATLTKLIAKVRELVPSL